VLGIPDHDLSNAVRRLATATLAGALVGLIWVGVVGRLAMRVIALLSPEATGLASDDDFVIGKFTAAGTFNFAVFGLFVGVLGGLVYLALRGLRIGPHWFQVLSLSLAPALVAMQQLVDPNGVDFTVLQPVEASLLLFLLVTWGYTLTVGLLVERWLARGLLASAPRPVVVLALLPVLPLAPLVAVVAAGWLVLRLVGPVPATGARVARGGLTVLFGFAVVDLARSVAQVV